MKKIFFLFLFFHVCFGNLFAQKQIGVAVLPVVMHPLHADNVETPINKNVFGLRASGPTQVLYKSPVNLAI